MNFFDKPKPPTNRDYQDAAIAAIEAEWQKGVRSTLCCLPTGTGKGSIIAELARKNDSGRSLILVHKRELARQMAKRLRLYGVESELEMGTAKARHGTYAAPVVVAMVQSLISGNEEDGRRLDKVPTLQFSRLFMDEIHHGASKSWMTVIKHLIDCNPKLMACGFTATPDRADGLALKQVCDTVAVNIPILHMIDAGWLVGIHQQVCKIHSLDFSKVRVIAGQFNGADLDRLLTEKKNLFGIADAIFQTVGTRKTLVFNTNIENAELTSEILNNHRPNCSATVNKGTPDKRREEILADFESGKIQFLTNVGIVGEGVDIPGVEVVACAAPTLSRSRYAQQIGRGTRPLPGIVDGLDGPEARRQAIAASAKPHCLILDFTGVNSSRHKLITAIDILGGKISEEAKELALREAEDTGRPGDLREALAAAEALEKILNEERQRKAMASTGGLTAKATVSLHYVDPFDMFQKRAEKYKNHSQRQLSAKQRLRLLRAAWDPDQHTLAENLVKHQSLISITPKQIPILIRAGYRLDEIKGLPVWEASELITAVKANGWKRLKQPPTQEAA